METKNTIRIVGYYTHRIGDPEDCTECGNADYGDVLVNGVCGRCLLSHLTPDAADKGNRPLDLAFDEIVEDTVYGEGA